MEKFLPTLYQGGYVQGPEATSLVHEAILALCHDVKDDAVSLVDAMAPPDFILNSVLGASDGQVWKIWFMEVVLIFSCRCISG